MLMGGCNQQAREQTDLLGNKPAVGIAEIASLHVGMMRADVERLLGGNGLHQFSARLPEGDFQCVSYAFGKPHVYYYFLFRVDELERITLPPPFEVELVPYRNVHLETRKPLNAEKRISEVLQAEPLSGGQLVTSLRSVLSGQTESINVLPAFIVAGPQFAKAEKSIQADYQRNELLAQKFDPEKIKLGDAEGRLVLDYGLPLIISTNQQNGIRLYCFGSDEPLRVNPAYRFSNLAVIVANGFVARIFSHDFYDREGNYTISEPQAEPKGNK